MEMLLDKMILYFHYPFVRYALIVGVLIAFCSSLLGVTLVLKRFSFIGDGLSHVAFGAMAVAAVFQMTNEMPLVLCITVACAVLLLRTGQGGFGISPFRSSGGSEQLCRKIFYRCIDTDPKDEVFDLSCFKVRDSFRQDTADFFSIDVNVVDPFDLRFQPADLLDGVCDSYGGS